MRTGRNSGERTVDDDYFLGMEVTYPEEHGSFDARTSNSSGPHEPAKGRNQAAPPPFLYAEVTPTNYTTWRAAPSRIPTAPCAAGRPGWARSAPA